MNAEKKQISDAYIGLMQTDGWKHLKSYADKEVELSTKRTDSKPAHELSINEVCEERGVRKGIQKIFSYANQCKEGV